MKIRTLRTEFLKILSQDMQTKKSGLRFFFSISHRVIFVFFFYILSSVFVQKPVFALETTFTSGSDWSAGTSSSLDSTVLDGQLQLQADGTWGAQAWRSPDLTLTIGSTFASDGTDIYVVRGVGDVTFWKYSPATDSWTELANLPRGAYYGADITVLNGSVYALFGGYQKAFARYDIASNSWSMLSDFPDLTYSGASLETDGTDIYGLRGNNTQEFFKYSVAQDTWTALAGTPATTRGGADLVYVDGFLYTLRGNNSNLLYRYSLAANSWTTLANFPVNISEDMDITTDGSSIYVTRQSNTNIFYRYDIAGNSWSSETNLPATARYAGVIYHAADGLLYVFQGNGQYNF